MPSIELTAAGRGQAEDACGDEQEGAGDAEVVGLQDAVLGQHPDRGRTGEDRARHDTGNVRLRLAWLLAHPRSTLMLPSLTSRSRVTCCGPALPSVPRSLRFSSALWPPWCWSRKATSPISADRFPVTSTFGGTLTMT